jgi:hypothetical protein
LLYIYIYIYIHVVYIYIYICVSIQHVSRGPHGALMTGCGGEVGIIMNVIQLDTIISKLCHRNVSIYYPWNDP